MSKRQTRWQMSMRRCVCVCVLKQIDELALCVSRLSHDCTQPLASIRSVDALRAGHGGARGVSNCGYGQSGQHAHPRVRPPRAPGSRQVGVHAPRAATRRHQHGRARGRLVCGEDEGRSGRKSRSLSPPGALFPHSFRRWRDQMDLCRCATVVVTSLAEASLHSPERWGEGWDFAELEARAVSGCCAL